MDGSFSSGLSGPVTTPLMPAAEEAHENNCNDLKNMMSNPKIKSKLQILQNKAAETREFGYGYNTSADPIELQLKTDSENLINVKIGGTYYGASHTHPNQQTTFFSPMFSISDIVSLAVLKKRYINPGATPLPDSKFVITLTFKMYNNPGTQTYAVKIENWGEFSNFIDQYISMTPDEKSGLGKKLAQNYSKIDRADPDAVNRHLLELLKNMKKINLKGVAIYKATDETLSEWEKQSLDTNNTIKSTPCK